MSLRKSLYKQNTRSATSAASASSSYVNLADASLEEKFWVRDWYDPPRLNKDLGLLQQQGGLSGQTQSALANSVESTPQPQQTGQQQQSQSQTPQPFKTYGYKIKTWIMVDTDPEYKDCADEENDTRLNLNNYQYLSNSQGTEDVKTNGDSGLTEADIKSAVGGTGGSSTLFSSSAAHAMKEESEQAQETGVTEKESEQSPKIEQIEEEQQDVVMSEN